MGKLRIVGHKDHFRSIIWPKNVANKAFMVAESDGNGCRPIVGDVVGVGHHGVEVQSLLRLAYLYIYVCEIPSVRVRAA